MASTIIEKIIGAHSERDVAPGDTVDVVIDSRVARDFGGANVVKNIEDHGLVIDDSGKTYFTFDCNPGGSDQKYAANQQICRRFITQKFRAEARSDTSTPLIRPSSSLSASAVHGSSP